MRRCEGFQRSNRVRGYRMGEVSWPGGLFWSEGTLIQALLLLLTVASWVYWLVAWWWVRELFHPRPTEDLSFTPPVSVLKPVKGLDFQAYENFVSFCRQDYAEYEVLFGVADASDPVVPVIERVQRDFPQVPIRLIIAPAMQVNRKASLLHILAARARYEILVASDSDMRVRPDYLRRLVAPFFDEQIALVTCPYRGEYPETLTARLEALHMGATFLPSVTVARRFLDMHFALGATMAVRKSALTRIGGFAAVADYLADDFQLGWRIAGLGFRVHLSNYVVASVLGPTTFREQWEREVRWARCNRVSRPWEYPGLVLTFSTPLAVIFLIATYFSPLGFLVVGLSLLLRWLVAWSVLGEIGARELRRWLFWLPVRDMLSALVWCAGAIGRRVVWRGEAFLVQGDGRLIACTPPPSAPVLPSGAETSARRDSPLDQSHPRDSVAVDPGPASPRHE
jgi:ceramide glucosyltransferase